VRATCFMDQELLAAVLAQGRSLSRVMRLEAFELLRLSLQRVDMPMMGVRASHDAAHRSRPPSWSTGDLTVLDKNYVAFLAP
jgi:hypothetical protein